jgi:alkanesulfonate monooxygenase SsuD/methylene tetrahydromethanopterin reductase-like flavin-dependent oxidoreductase (luciferase family)
MLEKNLRHDYNEALHKHSGDVEGILSEMGYLYKIQDKDSVVAQVKAAISDTLFGFLCKLHQIGDQDGDIARRFLSLLQARRLHLES